jgi:hypothetical protein
MGLQIGKTVNSGSSATGGKIMGLTPMLNQLELGPFISQELNNQFLY